MSLRSTVRTSLFVAIAVIASSCGADHPAATSKPPLLMFARDAKEAYPSATDKPPVLLQLPVESSTYATLQLFLDGDSATFDALGVAVLKGQLHDIPDPVEYGESEVGDLRVLTWVLDGGEMIALLSRSESFSSLRDLAVGMKWDDDVGAEFDVTSLTSMGPPAEAPFLGPNGGLIGQETGYAWRIDGNDEVSSALLGVQEMSQNLDIFLRWYLGEDGSSLELERLTVTAQMWRRGEGGPSEEGSQLPSAFVVWQQDEWFVSLECRNDFAESCDQIANSIRPATGAELEKLSRWAK